MKRRILPKNFFSKVRKITTPEEALKDVIPPEYVKKKDKKPVTSFFPFYLTFNTTLFMIKYL